MSLITLENIQKYYNKNKPSEVHALKGVSLTLEKGETVALMGVSGCGKSTLLSIIGCMSRPDSGRYLLDDTDVALSGAAQLARLRCRCVGSVLQDLGLIPYLSAAENAALPLMLGNTPLRSIKPRISSLFERLGIADKLNVPPSQLSGGQQQRVAIARALATRPRILLCDEATSALDPQSTQSILALIRDIHDKLGLTVIVITHQMSVVEQICTQVAILDNGAVAEVGPVSEVFASPSSQAAKRLVYPEGYDQPIASPGEHLVRIVFNGADSAKTPLIAHMAMHENIAASIVSASTRSIGGKTYGNMLLGIPGGAEELRRAMDYLGGTPDIIVEEVKPDEH